MRQYCRTSRLVAVSALLFLASSTEAAVKRRPITRERVAKVWIGFSEDELYMIRLNLKPEGDGLGAFSFVSEEPCVFSIHSWSYQKGKVEITLETPLKECMSGITFRGEIQGNAFEVTMKDHSWKRKASLRREEDLVVQWQRLRAAMEKQYGPAAPTRASPSTVMTL